MNVKTAFYTMLMATCSE